VRSNIYLPELVPTDYGFAATVAIPPGTTQVLFSYQARGTGGSFDLSRVALYTVSDLSVLSNVSGGAPPLKIESDRLERTGTVSIGKKSYARWSSTTRFEPGDSIPITAVVEAPISSWLIGGAIAGLTLMAGLAAWAWMRRARRSDEPASDKRTPEPRTKDDLLVAIAELDLAYQGGEVGKETWARRRAELKARMQQPGAPTAPEHAP
jgi:hypothetical protein